MRSVLKMELKKAFSNKLFFLAISVATAIAIYTAIFCIYKHYHFIDMDIMAGQVNNKIFNPELAGSSLFTAWIGDEHISPSGSLFYLLMPLLATLGYGWSYFTERKSGYVKNIISRTTKKNYFFSKYISVFLSGGTVITLPIIINILTVSAFVPAYRPDVFYDVYYTHHPWSTLTPLFYSHPFIYMIIKVAAIFIFAGVISAIALMITFLFNNKFVVTLLPFLLMLVINYISNSLSVLEFSPIQFLHCSKEYILLWIIVLEFLLLFLITFITTIVKGNKNDVF